MTAALPAAAVSPGERAALVALYEATSGEDWSTNFGWLGPPGSECTWIGVACDATEQQVLALVLRGNRLLGNIPQEISGLVHLESLDISRNGVGWVAGDYSGLAGLRSLHVNGTAVQADAIASMATIPGLTTLEFTGIQLDGVSVPAAIGGFPSLKALTLGGAFEGGGFSAMPPEIGQLQDLETLILDFNSLHELPAEVGQISGLEFVSLRHNSFTGLPEGLEGLPLRVLDMSTNDLGEFPQAILGLTDLESLDLSHTSGSLGPLPEGLGDLEKLRTVRIEFAGLEGPIPDSIGGLSALEVLVLRDNALTGTIPATFGELASLEGLDLARNELSGGLPPEIGALSELQHLDLNRNQIAGPIPATWAELDNLSFVDLADNWLTGPLPPEIGGMSALKNLRLSRNQITGSLPPELGLLSKLQQLELNENQLTGSIPPQLGGATRLRTLNLNDNALTGSLPAELGDLLDAQRLDVTRNQLTGPIPWQLNRFFFLELSENQLTGPLDPRIMEPRVLRLNASFNQISGELVLPAESALFELNLAHNQMSGQLPNVAALNARDVYLSHNQFTGSLPAIETTSNFSILATLDLSRNPFTPGPIPDLEDALNNCVAICQLRSLDLSATSRTGELPLWPVEAGFLAVLRLRDNPLTPGPIPAELGQGTLQILDLGHTRRTGRLPADLAVRPNGAQSRLTELYLDGNALIAGIPPEWEAFASLQELDLSANKLTGQVPSSFQDFWNLRFRESLDLRWNGLGNGDPQVAAALNEAQTGDQDWRATQTIQVRKVQAQVLSPTSIEVSWRPIRYQQDRGGYRIFLAENLGGPYFVGGQTQNKSADSFVVDGLEPGKRYFVLIRTVTLPHADNANRVVSRPSAAVSVTTPIPPPTS